MADLRRHFFSLFLRSVSSQELLFGKWLELRAPVLEMTRAGDYMMPFLFLFLLCS